MEQAQLMQKLEQQSTSNPDTIDMEAAIQSMTEAKEVKIEI